MQPPGIIKVRGGKIVNPKPRKVVQTPKSTFVRQLIFQFNCAIERDARLLVKFRKRGQLTSRLESLIEGVYREIISVIRAFPPTGNRIPKAFNNQIQQLEKANEHFVNNFQSELIGTGTQGKRVELYWVGLLGIFSTSLKISMQTTHQSPWNLANMAKYFHQHGNTFRTEVPIKIAKKYLKTLLKIGKPLRVHLTSIQDTKWFSYL
jgi:hypothetical protein